MKVSEIEAFGAQDPLHRPGLENVTNDTDAIHDSTYL